MLVTAPGWAATGPLIDQLRITPAGGSAALAVTTTASSSTARLGVNTRPTRSADLRFMRGF